MSHRSRGVTAPFRHFLFTWTRWSELVEQLLLPQTAPNSSSMKLQYDNSMCDTPHLSPPPPEFNNSLPELLCSDEDSGNEDVLDMEYTEAEAENLKRNAEVCAALLTLTGSTFG